ncbi:MAG TPA: GNAT family N-acetyltransferase [Coriobacteriia bacterium]|jgi:ribosomal protein S18 acetylase RimI-like enzyme
MSGILRPAQPADLAWLWPPVRASQIFEHADELERFWAEAPWRVRVNGRGEAAVLVRWREHMDLLAIKGLWCSERRVPLLLEDLRAVAREQGFGRLLSPLLPESAARPYVDDGMQPVQKIVVMRLDVRRRRHLLEARDAAGVTLRIGSLADTDAVLAVDNAAFETFWRYDRRLMTQYVTSERLGVAEAGGRVVGYTLCTVRRGEGSIGRLAVRPDLQGRGIGAVLLEDAVAFLERDRAERVTLCTQAENLRSRKLYTGAGFKEVPGLLLGLVSGPL